MKCVKCGKSFPSNFQKCPYCNNAKPDENTQILFIKQNLEYLKNLKNYFETAIFNIEQSLSEIESSLPEIQREKIVKPVKIQHIQKSAKKEKEPFIERFLGEKFLLTVGILAILFASAFFLKYSFERNLFTPVFRVTVTAIFGLFLTFIGYYLKSKYRIFGVILITGGIAVLFFSNFASFVLYKFYGTLLAFAINLVLVAISLFLAIKFNSQWVSIVGIGGAYLTFTTLKNSITNDIGFFSYLLVLSFAPVFLAYKKRWNTIVILANIFTTMWFYMWYYSYFKSNASIYFIYFGIWFYLVFLASALFYFKEEEKYSLFALSPLIATFFYPLISVKAMSFSGIHLISPSILYIISGIVLTGISYLKKFNNREKIFLFVSGILTVFVGIYFNFKSIDFSAFLSIILILSIYLYGILERKWLLLLNGSLILLLFFKSTTYDIFENLGFKFNHFAFKDYQNIASRIMEYFAVITAFSINSKVALRKNSKIFAAFSSFFTGLSILVFLTYEISTIFYKVFEKGQSMGITALWVVFAFILLFIGLKKSSNAYRIFAFVLFGIVLFKLFFIDIISLSALYRVLAFLITGIVLIVSSYIYYKFGKKENKNEN
ncbi:conserved hypothetical protein [Thermotomaculum hydrothermale]|uniref:DUF2339 domain-containing protein n=1 Tax=Thermotomaculum hydrothermale TaxID=981385 RepID=A0A7R6PY43_9BACT|nr:DUF2339 domain-containing protein [Thermotomaculum hydrothermale]BBB31723.1 conserved hypothetical protein [Thermotomaculum hydrothermale]